MTSSVNSSLVPPTDDRLTIIAIGVLAFILADVAHEIIGHGIGFFLAGGRSGIFTTTRLIETQQLGERGGDLFDLGGPFGNLLFAFLPWLAQRLLRRSSPQLRLCLWLLTAFSLFWTFGYLIFCGVLARGDWFALIRRAPLLPLWRVLFVVGGIALYRGSIRLVASELHWIVSVGDFHGPFRVRRLALLSYVAGGLIACAGAALDPRGPTEILYSGVLSSFAAAVGLLSVPPLFLLRKEDRSSNYGPILRRPGWILSAAVVSIFYIALLGPGIRFSF